jgi:pimeloyl-ACP methyl ester carboxylesterase
VTGNATVRRGYVDTEFGQVHYYAAGQQGPLLFLFHETALSGSEFVPVLPLLGARCRAIAIDTPGYGLSDAPESPCDMKNMCARIFAAMQEFGDGPVILAGVHTGSSFALELAATTLRDRVTHVVMSGLALLTPDEIESFRSIISTPKIDRDGRFLVVEWEKRRERWGDDIELSDILWGTIEQLKVYQRFHWAFEAIFSHDAERALRSLSQPTYFLVGENDSLVECDKKAVLLANNAKLEVLAGIGGRLPYFQPDVYAQKLLRFAGLN